ncbi:MAG: T9SS type A sorting domain-containing protein [Bacteroidota bacterium]
MKKNYLLIAFMAISCLTFAQTKSGLNSNAQKHTGKPSIIFLQDKAIGDTLMHFDGYNFFVTNPTDNAAFTMLNEDLDLLTPTNTYNSGAFNFFYDTTSAPGQTNFLHDDVDTANYMEATSWFQAPGQSDDWFSFGPITLPANGASITWAVKWNGGKGHIYKDSYGVFVSKTGMSNYVDFGTEPIYFSKDTFINPATDAIDSTWHYYSVDIPSSNNGLPVYVGFQHYAYDMEVIYLDEISIIEKNTISVDDKNAVKPINVFPNPAKDILNISNLGKDAKISLINSLGQIIFSTIASDNTIINTENISEGVYFIKVNANVSKVIIKK